jgi:hypothetical protein
LRKNKDKARAELVILIQRALKGAGRGSVPIIVQTSLVIEKLRKKASIVSDWLEWKVELQEEGSQSCQLHLLVHLISKTKTRQKNQIKKNE